MCENVPKSQAHPSYISAFHYLIIHTPFYRFVYVKCVRVGILTRGCYHIILVNVCRCHLDRFILQIMLLLLKLASTYCLLAIKAVAWCNKIKDVIIRGLSSNVHIKTDLNSISREAKIVLPVKKKLFGGIVYDTCTDLK